MNNDFNNLYEFGDFRFDGKRLKLWHHDKQILLSPKASELLNLLLERGGEFVSKEEIFETVWKDTFVEDGVLTQNIYTLRKSLGDQNLIENKTRRGYRITAPISVSEAKIQTNEKISPETAEKQSLEPSRRRFPPFALLMISLILLGGIGFLAVRYFLPRTASIFRKDVQSIKFTKLTDTGDLSNAVISPDGNLIAFSRENQLFLKDIVNEKELKIDISNVQSFSSLQFSANGDFLYFRNNKILSAQAAIMKVSRFGGEAEVVVERSWGSFNVSPDGKNIAYFLNVPPIAKFNLKIRNLETGEEKEFFAAEQPNSPCMICAPAWSPDSKKIIFTTNIPTGTGQLFLVNLETDAKDEIKLEKLRRFEQAAWLPEGDAFIVSATEGSRFFHLWKVFIADGEIQSLTNGLTSYGRISISANGKKILALQSDEISNIFISNADKLNEQKPVTLGNQNSFGQNGLHWVDDRRILYSTQTEQNLADNLAILNLADNSKTAVTNDRQNSFRVPVSDGKQIWFTMNKGGFGQIFQMDLDGKNIRQLTTGNEGQRVSPRITNDSKFLYYVLRGKDGGKVMRYDLQNQKEEVLFNNPEYQPGPFLELSPDNKLLTFFKMQNRPENAADEFNAVMTVVSIENTNDVKTFPVSAVPPIRRFSPDSRFIDYIYAATDATQIVRQPLDGSEPKPIYTAAEGKIFNFAWSKSGKQLAVARGQQLKDAVLLTEFNP